MWICSFYRHFSNISHKIRSYFWNDIDDAYSCLAEDAHYALSLPIQIHLKRAKFYEAFGIENDTRKYALTAKHSHVATFKLGCVMGGYKHEYVDRI